MGAQRLAREAGLPQAQAKEFLSRFKQRYPKVFAFLELQERLALSRGYVETILGRRRPFHFDPGGLGRLLGRDPLAIDLEAARRGGMEGQQLRAAANAPIQGSSADIIKLAMVQLHRTLGERACRRGCCSRCTMNWCWRSPPQPSRRCAISPAARWSRRCSCGCLCGWKRAWVRTGWRRSKPEARGRPPGAHGKIRFNAANRRAWNQPRHHRAEKASSLPGAAAVGWLRSPPR